MRNAVSMSSSGGIGRSRFSIVSASATNTGWSASPWQQRPQLLLPAVQRLDAAPLVLGLVGEVVGAARERVQRDQVRAQLGRHEARRDRVALGVRARELLAVGVGALDGPRAGRRIQPADRRAVDGRQRRRASRAAFAASRPSAQQLADHVRPPSDGRFRLEHGEAAATCGAAPCGRAGCPRSPARAAPPGSTPGRRCR